MSEFEIKEPFNSNKASKETMPVSPSPQEINSLVALLNEGRYADAISLAQTMTVRFPLHGFGWKVLGALFKQMGRNADALIPMQKAAELSPEDAEVYNNLGVTLKGLGRLDEAEASYHRALEINPDDADIHYNLGGILQGLGRPDEAELSYRRTLEINPDYAETYNNLSVILHGLGRLDEAEACCRRALEIKADYSEAQCNLGKTLKALGRLDEAEASYRRALQIKPDSAEAHNNLGNTLKDLGRLDEAEASYRQALQLRPDYAEAHNNLSVTLKAQGCLDEAEASCRRALKINPDFAEAHHNMGATLTDRGKLNEAEASCRRAVEIKPDFAEAHYNLGGTLHDLDRFDEAEACFRRALQIKPDYVQAHNNLGNTLMGLDQPVEAEASFRRALQLKPDYAEAHYNLGCVLQIMGRQDEAEVCFRRTLQIDPYYASAYINMGVTRQKNGQLDEAEVYYRRALELKPDYVIAHSNLIFALDLMSGKDSASLLEERKRWNATHAAHLHQQLPHSNIPDPERRIRIGYVSTDFREHSAPKAFGSMLTCYDCSQFDVVAYSNFRGKDDRFTELFKQNVTDWRGIGSLSDDAVAKMIREDRIDILVDLSGHTAGNRLLVFARKPAPIQITAWGYAMGTGMQAMDVFFNDPVMVPPEEQQYFTEQVRYLPSVVSAFFIDPFPDVNTLPALSDGIITFGSLNRLAKVSEESYCAWVQVLLAIPQSRLIMKTAELGDALTRKRVAELFIKAGITADRIILLGNTSWYEHMQAYHRIDIALDPFPHGGGVTALEGLMMGVPVINLRGPTAAGRGSASYMTTLGLPDWIAENREQYVELTIRKAADLQSLAALRQQLRDIFNSSVLGDQTAYTRAVEQEYRKLWQEWCSPV